MLAQKSVVLDIEGYNFRNSKFIVKELAVCGDYLDSIVFGPPKEYSTLTVDELKTYTWLFKHLHGLDWNTGDLNYCYLRQICESIKLRYPGAKFYSKGVEKSLIVAELLDTPVFNLEDLGCPKVNFLVVPKESYFCANHSKVLVGAQRQVHIEQHCARFKAKAFANWLERYESRQAAKDSDSVVAEFDSLRLNIEKPSASNNTRTRRSSWSEDSEEEPNLFDARRN